MNEQTSQPTTAGPGEATPSESVRGALRQARDEVKARASDAVSKAKGQVSQQANEGKARAAERLEGVSDSIRHTAERMEGEHDPNIAHYTRVVADKLESAASYIRDREFRDLTRDAEELARRHPAVFFGGLFVAGMALARFAKASRGRADAQQVEGAASPVGMQASEPMPVSER